MTGSTPTTAGSEADTATSSKASRTVDRFKLPGFGLPLNFTPRAATTVQAYENEQWQDVFQPALGEGEALFPTALNTNDLDDGIALQPLLTSREIAMMRIMCEITEKPMWHEKVFNRTISKKWRKEALEAPDLDISEKMMAWCIDELRYKAVLPAFRDFGAVSVYDGDVVKSDTIIPQDVKEALKEAVKPLEEVPERLRDWHPGSDEQVLDLVHPSLFPLVYGRSKVLPDGLTSLEDFIQKCGEGVQVQVPQEQELFVGKVQWNSQRRLKPFSPKFQWLPCDVDISGDRARITSYINNLHPQQHPRLYTLIEDIITRILPLWNITLTPLRARSWGFRRIPFKSPNFVKPAEEEPPQVEDENDEDYERRIFDWIRGNRVIVQPEPGQFEPPSFPVGLRRQNQRKSGELKPEQVVDLKRDYGTRGLQVIVKLANIHLTPEKPNYPGGTWHVEGQLNEHICATAIYYYDNDNITPTSLAFRQVPNNESVDEFKYEQNDHDWLKPIFGLEPDGSSIQELGSVKAIEGRVVTFPNILQHQVQPFQLADPTRPGHRKILAFFLVDPHLRIISTANVPCQRRDWWKEALRESALSKLPVELQDRVVNQVEEFPIDLSEAKELREELMEERKHFVVEHQHTLARNYTISLCEH
ncbi:hypothetical protein BDN72DRAFT_961786 [Pluteus cervinus]|uniref:Uncharacterized protein n=1 Tax=Pluteus cervinus TaxID=181527 RepID=A0ACD3ALM9_9AGAR|nr:hypothetical protein BDN72DRAFT_961786 [Pluteus cervinus]